ncbi:type VI secretion system baseplate subunit TssE [Thalassotalea euphylliae]|uniref:Type VI secretion system baseplate subunit TssE n=1 Tax=Thalassotalea euphylliae TaxID=1655234 RepID=A0A3E0TTE0_9GAMM|nr:type VI secretion system baseplate subunit TssE [Thalassotalea euphylliae]REL27684.1 type VI secretion system baseplate subunit TssE [Thalassotalea euphylliae]
MPELSPLERLQPSLLDRLTDDEPSQQTESRERRIISINQLKKLVQRDVSWLLNTRNLETVENLSRYPEVQSSVLNYGILDLAGIPTSSFDELRIERALVKSFRQFESRLLPNSIKLKAKINRDEMNANAITFELMADMWAQPMPLQLYIETDVDLENGMFNFARVN